jgi:hypothetical protein
VDLTVLEPDVFYLLQFKKIVTLRLKN